MSKKGIKILSIIVVLIVSLSFVLAWADDNTLNQNVTGCGILNTTNAVYTLQNNVTGDATCFNITANNVVLKGARHTVKGNDPYGGSSVYGIILTNVQNVTVRNFSGIYDFTYLIALQNSSNNFIAENTMDPYDPWNSCDCSVSLYIGTNSSNNTFLNNDMRPLSSSCGGDLNYFIRDRSGLGNLNYIIYNNSFGEIRWTNPTLLDDLSILTDTDYAGRGFALSARTMFLTMHIENNSAILTNYIPSNYNTEVNVTFHNLGNRGYTNPTILAGFSRCNATTTPSCTNFTALNANEVTFSISSLKNLAVSIGDYIPNGLHSCKMNLSTPNTTYNLQKTLYLSDTCFTIGADNITIEGNGYSVIGRNRTASLYGYDNGYGFDAAVYGANAHTNLTFRNITIENFATDIYAPGQVGSGYPWTSGYKGGTLYIYDSRVNSILAYGGRGPGSPGGGGDGGDISLYNSRANTLWAYGGNSTGSFMPNGEGGNVYLEAEVINLSSMNINVHSGYGQPGQAALPANDGKLTINYTSSFQDENTNYGQGINFKVVNPYGIIDWLLRGVNPANITNLSRNINLSKNLVFVNSSVLTDLNFSADITLYNLSTNYAIPKIFRNGAEVCNETTTPACYNFTALNAGTVRFNVSEFSNYSIIETYIAPVVENQVEANSNSGSSSGGGSGSSSYASYFLPDSPGSKLIKNLSKNDKISFNIKNETHTFTLISINNQSITGELRSNPITFQLNLREEKKFDLNFDGIYDVSLILNSLNKKAEVTLMTFNETIESPILSQNKENNLPITESQAKKDNSKTSYLWIKLNMIILILIFILVILVISLYLFYLKNRSKTRKSRLVTSN